MKGITLMRRIAKSWSLKVKITTYSYGRVVEIHDTLSPYRSGQIIFGNDADDFINRLRAFKEEFNAKVTHLQIKELKDIHNFDSILNGAVHHA